MKGSIWAVVVVIILLVVGALAIPAAMADGATSEEATETHTIWTDDPTELDESDTWFELVPNETVTWDDNGTTVELTRDEDYSINETAGTILAEDPQYDGETIEIFYEYTVLDAQTEQIAGLFGLLVLFAPWIIIAVVLGAVMSLALGRW